jgi:hypothetical protein
MAVRLIAILCAFVLLACSPLLGKPQAKASPAASDSAAAIKSLQAFVPVAEKFVEAHRGLKFKSQVKVTFLADAEFQAELEKTSGLDAAGFVTEAKVLHALGLLDGRPDLLKAEKSLQGSSVIGFYDTDTKQLFVRGVEAKPSVRHVLVHELTHALQDQWFAIGRTNSSEDESDIAYRTLVEGDAVRIEDQYIASLGAAEKRQIQEADAAFGPLPAGVPNILLELDSFPYLVGPGFTQSVVAGGGQARLDAAFKSPPTTTAEVIHPGIFLAGLTPASVDLPGADGAVIDKGVLGELGLDLLLERLTARSQVTSSQAQAVTAGWSGDRYIAWDQGAQACVRTRFVMSGQDATKALLAALRQFAGDQPGTTIEGSGPILFTACA